jgi:hypothetical protein
MSNQFFTNPTLSDHLLRQQKLCFNFSITSNATPASKVHSSDLAGVVHLRTEGKTAEADAIEDLSASFTTAADNSTGDSVFGVLIDCSGLPAIRKVNQIRMTEISTVSTSEALTNLGTNGLTADGNIAFNIAASGLNLASESPTFFVEIDFLLAP